MFSCVPEIFITILNWRRFQIGETMKSWLEMDRIDSYWVGHPTDMDIGMVVTM